MTTGTGIISGISVSHRRASVDTIEAVCRTDAATAVERLLDTPGVTEAFVLQTCNRAEAYVVTETERTGREALATYAESAPDETTERFDHEGSLRHLMRVTAGLESLVLGEDQIIGQVRRAYEAAREAGALGPVLDDAILKALHVGERARAETAINEGVVSLGSAAVALLETERDLDDATALVVGAGEMGTLAAKALDPAVTRVIVANRTRSTADHVATNLDGDATAVGLDALPIAVEEADVVVTATGAEGHVLDREVLAGAGETHIVDLGQPRDVAPDVSGLRGVIAHDLDDLQAVTDETRAQREAAAAEVEAMLDDEFEHLMAQYKRKRADQVIAGMYEGAERMKARELEKALSKLESAGDVTDEQRAIVESMADALVSQLLASPTQSLRDAAEEDDWTTIHTAIRLFDPKSGAPPNLEDASVDEIPDAVKGQMPAAVLEQLAADDD
ncbi:glutamyl-tRNA reductase [Natronomonas sp. EA1]|uniref:glutamyl-tRNA reductase n=1 Tax=Natronomonas sp. EA1 TaxID=3421655 RepID=UPI003EC0C012